MFFIIVNFTNLFISFCGKDSKLIAINKTIWLHIELQVFLLCLIAGCSICWFNTICYVLCIRHFTANRSLALSLSISFNGVSAALYTLIANAINSSDDTLYLLLNALVPILISLLVLIPILYQPQPQPHSVETLHRDSLVFLCLNILALVTGLYLLFLYSFSSSSTVARVILAGAICLLALLLFLPGIVYSREWSCFTVPNSFCLYDSSYSLIDNDGCDDHELQKELIGTDENSTARNNNNNNGSVVPQNIMGENKRSRCCGCCFGNVLEGEKLTMLGEEHTVRLLIRRWDFWLYYMAYFCGGTIGLVYSNNLGQISQSLGHYSQTSSLVTLYSTCSFFGRLLSAAPDFLSRYVCVRGLCSR